MRAQQALVLGDWNYVIFTKTIAEMDPTQVGIFLITCILKVKLNCLVVCCIEVAQGVYSLDDLKELGAARGWCPYFMTRHLIHHSTILVYNYQYMLDPKGKMQLLCI